MVRRIGFGLKRRHANDDGGFVRPISILFGTETGNAESCAKELKGDLAAKGFAAKVYDMVEYPHHALPNERLVLIVTSTFGHGDPPVNAHDFMAHLKEDSPDVTGIRFSVCALGDSSFPMFAQCGKDFDRLLGTLGGERVAERVDCDGEYEVPFARWKTSVLTYLEANPELFPQGAEPEPEASSGGGFFGWLSRLFGGGATPAPAAAPKPVPAAAPVTTAAARPAGTREDPITVKLVSNTLLSKAGSNKETRHYVIDLADTGLSFHPGDCFGVYPENCPEEVAAVVAALGGEAAAQVTWDGETRSLSDVLTRSACLNSVSMKLVELLAQSEGPAKAALDGDPEALSTWMSERLVLDALQAHASAALDAQAVVSTLRPMQPRLYSVANSPAQHPNEVHFTVETTRYRAHDRDIKGVASCWLAERAHETGIPIYLQANPAFRLPGADTPVIMVGPGTGVAPFRAFLQERKGSGATGKNWLFFGHQHEDRDFLYQDELTGFVDDGTLAELTCAWSRDTDRKVYVQHKLLERADEVWQWLEAGAAVYVCGDASGMAPGVHAALIELVEARGVADGEQFLKDLEQANRYQRDVY